MIGERDGVEDVGSETLLSVLVLAGLADTIVHRWQDHRTYSPRPVMT